MNTKHYFCRASFSFRSETFRAGKTIELDDAQAKEFAEANLIELPDSEESKPKGKAKAKPTTAPVA